MKNLKKNKVSVMVFFEFAIAASGLIGLGFYLLSSGVVEARSNILLGVELLSFQGYFPLLTLFSGGICWFIAGFFTLLTFTQATKKE